MKKAMLIFLMICFITPTSSFSGLTKNYIGVGARLSLAAPENRGAAFGFGGHCLFDGKISSIGRFQFIPNLSFWFASDENSYRYSVTIIDEYEYRYWQIAMNFSDLKYYFPVPSSFVVEPYVGTGIALVINFSKSRHTHTAPGNSYSTSWNPTSDVDAAVNFFAGIDIPISKKIILFTEIRLTASPQFVFRFTGGLSFTF